MNRNLKIGLVSLGGMAVIAGTYQYFQNRIPLQQRYEKLLLQFKEEYFNCQNFKLTTMKLKFDKLFSLALQIDNPNGTKDIKKFISSKHQDHNKSYCNKLLNKGSTYYQCYECSPIIQQLKSEKKETQDGQVYLPICEDCFDVQKHKKHHVQIFQVQNTEMIYCYCGDSNICSKDSFCQIHIGYKNEQFDHDKQDCSAFYQGIKTFFLDQFHIVFDKLSDLMNSEETENQNQEENYDKVISRVNILLENIILKINEIIEVIPNSIYFFPKLLNSYLQKPISFVIQDKNDFSSNWDRQFNEYKQVNNACTIYDYILLFYEHLSKENDILLGQLFGNLLKSDNSFCLYASKSFFMYIEFTIRITENDQQNGIVLTLPSFTEYLTKYICLQKVFDYLVESLGSKIFIPISVFTHFIQNSGNKNRQEISKLINQFTLICLEMFRFQNQILNLFKRFPDQCIESLYQLSYTMFTVNSILLPTQMEEYKQENQKFILSNLLGSLFFKSLEKQLIFSFENLYKSLLLNNDTILSNQGLSIIIIAFKKYLKKAIEFIDFISSKQVLFKSFSMSFITHLPLMIALQERSVFQKEVLDQFFFKFFDLGESMSQMEKELIMKKTFRDLFVVMDKSILMHSKPNLKQQIYFYISQQEQYFPEQAKEIKTTFGFIEEFLYSPEYRVYDYYILTYSLLLLADSRPILDQQVNCFNLQFSYFGNFKNQEINPTTIFASQDCSDLVLQLILDGSVLINVFQNVYNEYFNLREHQDTLLQQNIKELIVTTIQENQSSKLFLKDISQSISNTLSDISQINYYIQQVCEVDFSNGYEKQEDNQQLILKKEYIDKFYARHILRRSRGSIDKLLTIQLQKLKNSTFEFCSVGNHFQLKNLFLYQQDLSKKIYFDLDYQKKLVEYHKINQVQTYPTAILYKHIYVTLNVLFSDEQNASNITEDLKLKRNSIIKAYNDKQILKIYEQSELSDYIEKTKPSDLHRTYTFIMKQLKSKLIDQI